MNADPPFAFPPEPDADLPWETPQHTLGHSVIVGLLQADLRIPLCRSLKIKRGILARTLNHVRKKYPVSVAEVGHRDMWDRAGLAASVVSSDSAVVERTLRGVAELLSRDAEVELIDYAIQLL